MYNKRTKNLHKEIYVDFFYAKKRQNKEKMI